MSCCSVITNYLIAESEVVTGKSQTEALPYWQNGSKERKKNLNSRTSRNFTSGDARAYLFKLHDGIQQTNEYSVKKIYLFVENNDQYVRKKYFITVVLLYHERISNVNSYRKKFSSNLLKSCAAVSVKENTI